MAKKNFAPQSKEKLALGKLIRLLRESKELSLRALATDVGLSPSNLTYIENGINVPTGKIYLKIIEITHPDEEFRRKMDELYIKIRQLPPPDICEFLIKNPNMIERIRKEIYLSSDAKKENKNNGRH